MSMILSDELVRVLRYATDEAMRTGAREVGVDHVLLAIIRDGNNGAADVLRMLGVDLQECKHFIESRISRGTMVPFSERDSIAVSREVQSMISLSMAEASSRGCDRAGAVHALSSMFNLSGGEGRKYLAELGVTRSAVDGLAPAVSKPASPVTGPAISYIGINSTNNKISS